MYPSSYLEINFLEPKLDELKRKKILTKINATLIPGMSISVFHW